MQHLRQLKSADGLDLDGDPRPAAAWRVSMPVMLGSIPARVEPEEKTVGGWRVLRPR